MFRNYLKIALRNIWKNRIYSAINILGLAIGIAASLLILLYVRYEFSYDRHHENLDRIYRINISVSLSGNDILATTSPYPMAATLENEFPEVESAARFRRFFRETLVSIDDIRYQESEVFHADPEFFEIFTVDFVSGDQPTALVEPNSIVITETIAAKYFGDEPALGRTLRFNNDRDYEVTGVIRDLLANSHFHPDILVSFTSDPNYDSTGWLGNNIRTYFMIREGSSAEELEGKLQTLVEKYVAPQIEIGIGASFQEFVAGGGRWEFQMFPVRDIHLYSQLQGELEPSGNAAYVYTFQVVAVFILLLACINFMNLSTARSANRAREIGIRKVVGAYRSQLVSQFLAESILVSFLALLIALPLVYAILPTLNAIIERELSLDLLQNVWTLVLLFLFATTIGTLSGSYPAFYLARFHPEEVLKGNLSRGGRNQMVRGSLVVFQFVISISLIAATLIVFNQLDFLRNKPLGFDKEQVLVINRAEALGEQRENFTAQIRLNPSVINASSSTRIPSEAGDQNAFTVEGRPASETYVLSRFDVDYDYVETLGLEIASGRSFSRDFTGDHPGFILNEAAVEHLGIEDPLQSQITEPAEAGDMAAPIIGVVRDFHFLSLHREIEPMVMRFIEGDARFVVVRVLPGNVAGTIDTIERLWQDITQGQPFDYSFLDENFDALHQGEQKLGEVFLAFSLLAIFIACLGLYGLASFSTEQRTKEIGVRKTLGATISSIVVLITREFIVLVAIAIAFAVPIAYLAMNQWLELFAYRTEIDLSVFLISGVTAIAIAFITVCYQSVAAASMNPALTLRDE